ncbi:MAG TPA: dihydroneopterin aldolase [Candidatus Baltobacteraceae bacterium]|nr:dihydroneopterin aldolase [Candidatus Baltobacteraceae bacterium]
MPDRILLSGISFYGYHGVYEEERRLGQRFLVDVELQLNLAGAEHWTDVSATVDYSQVVASVLEVGTGTPCPLIETVAARMATALLSRFRCQHVTVRLTKPNPPMPGFGGQVAAEVTRP